MAHRIWPGTRALAQLHLDQGQRVWLVTAAPIEIATIIARRLGLTGALGTVAEHVDGVYTGELVGEMLHGSAKAVAVTELAERFGLDLARCSAYSDSYNDLPMLSAVGDPCAINPDARLREHARAHDWRIRDYRTGRKAARAGVFAAAVAGAAAGTVAAGAAIRRGSADPTTGCRRCAWFPRPQRRVQLSTQGASWVQPARGDWGHVPVHKGHTGHVRSQMSNGEKSDIRLAGEQPWSK